MVGYQLDSCVDGVAASMMILELSITIVPPPKLTTTFLPYLDYDVGYHT
jgi:hypothetical protein